MDKEKKIYEKLQEVTAQLEFFESEQSHNPSKSISTIIKQLKVRKGTLEEIVG